MKWSNRRKPRRAVLAPEKQGVRASGRKISLGPSLPFPSSFLAIPRGCGAIFDLTAAVGPAAPASARSAMRRRDAAPRPARRRTPSATIPRIAWMTIVHSLLIRHSHRDYVLCMFLSRFCTRKYFGAASVGARRRRRGCARRNPCRIRFRFIAHQLISPFGRRKTQVRYTVKFASGTNNQFKATLTR